MSSGSRSPLKAISFSEKNAATMLLLVVVSGVAEELRRAPTSVTLLDDRDYELKL